MKKTIELNIKNNIYIIKRKLIYEFLKRSIDMIAAFFAIILLSWLFLFLIILVKCTSRGPVFYVSTRIGKMGKPFHFFKFRTMRNGAEAELEELLKYNETNGITFKMKDDPRITKFGKFLRKTSLDELPQLFNILFGSMSIVGPRPATPREVDLYNDYQYQRLYVKQGLTCIWQCSGRSDTTFEEQVEMDLTYIQKQGFFYDILLVLKTIPAVLFSKGAK